MIEVHVEVHVAAPVDALSDGYGFCNGCGEHIKRVPGGDGSVWIHSITGCVAAANRVSEMA